MPPVRGLIVIGCGVDSGEIPVAIAACMAARAAGRQANPFASVAIGPGAEADAGLVAGVPAPPALAHRDTASPALAASHSGRTLDPRELVDAARAVADEAVLVAAAPGGFFAPLTDHYTNRDFARELGVPVVVAARAAGGVVG